MLFLVAVASHKFIVGFCMGLELVSTGSSTCKLAVASFVFAISSVIGIGIGMFTSEVSDACAFDIKNLINH